LFEISFGHGGDRFFCMNKRVLQSSDDFGFIGCGFFKSFYIESNRWRSSNKLVEIEIGSAYVKKNFSKGTHVRRRAPGIFLGGNCFSQAREFIFLHDELRHYLRAITGKPSSAVLVRIYLSGSWKCRSC